MTAHLCRRIESAVRRGVVVWIGCKHCDAWIDYDFDDGYQRALEDSIEDE